MLSRTRTFVYSKRLSKVECACRPICPERRRVIY